MNSEQNWIKKISQPFYQICLFFLSIVIVGYLSYKAINMDLPLEEPPQIIQIDSKTLAEWNTQPTIVTVGLQIIDIPKFNALENKFSFDAKLWFLFDPELVSLETIKNFSFEKSKIASQSEPELKLINNLLRAEFDIKIKQSTALIHSTFPFDSHTIYISIINKGSSPGEIQFQSTHDQFIIGSYIAIPEWDIVSRSIGTGYQEIQLDAADSNNVVRHPKIIFSINVNRSGLRHIFIILLPLFLICAMCMIAIGSQELIGNKVLDITVAGAASIIAYRFVIESLSPQVSSFTIADYIFIFFLIVVCIQVVFSKITYEKPLNDKILCARSLLVCIQYLFFVLLCWYLLFIWSPGLQKTQSLPQNSYVTSALQKQIKKSSPVIEVKPQEFVLGSTLDLSRTDQSFAQYIKKGIELRISVGESETQDIPRIIFLDDESLALKALANIKLFKNKDITTLFSPVGSSTLKGYRSLIEGQEIAVLFPITGSSLFRSPELTNIIHFRPSFGQEGFALTQYAFEQLGAGRILFFYEDSPLGTETLNGAKQYIKKAGIADDYSVSVSYPKRSTQFSGQEETIKQSNPDTIIFFSTPHAAQEMIKQLGLENIVGKTLLGSSHLNNSQFQQFCKDLGISVITSTVVPNPNTSKLTLAQEFRKHCKENNVPINACAFEGYINTELLLYALKQIKRPYNARALISVFEEMQDLELKGIQLNFEPTTRQLSTALWLDTNADEWEKIDIAAVPMNKELE